ncbi:MAG TPA: hypothetical protein VHO69_19740 [Phototrophicaceae bacterium]|nr:hypothetical protein [Phototrophicaceae bacterium]
MIWALVLAWLVVIVVMVLNNSDQTPWIGKLRRIHAGVAQKAEWMAPDEVVAQVRADYLEAVQWLQDSAQADATSQLLQATVYLDGLYLARYRTLVNENDLQGEPRFIGVMRADHQVQVRHFSEDGRRCLVLDQQTQRRMATYDRRQQTRLHTQDLGDETVVYQMVYDSRAQRWKIEVFIQELPAGWGSASGSQRVRLAFRLPAATGRDS